MISDNSIARQGRGATFPRVRSRGFTLLELLIVMTIISLLMTLVVQVIGSFLDQARQAATRTTITKINALLTARGQALDRQMQRPGYLNNTVEYQILTNPALAAYQQQSAQVQGASFPTRVILAKKLLEAKYFPQRVSELYDFTLYPNPNVPGTSLVGTTVIQPPELLYYFLTQNVLGDTPVGTDAFSTAEVQDKNQNGFPEFLDAWGNPIRFYRWPTRLFRPKGYATNNQVTFVPPPSANDLANAALVFSVLPSNATTTDLGRDPDDPLQRCWSQFQMPQNTNVFEQTSVQIPINQNNSVSVFFHTPATYHVHLVVSAGADGQFGMFAPDDSDPQDVSKIGHLGGVKDPLALQDDIISISVKAGGK